MDVGMTLQASPLFRHQRSLVPYGVLSKFATPSPRSQGHCLPTRIRARIRPAIQPTDGHYRQWMDQRSFVAICIILAQPRQRLNSQVRFTIWYGVAKEIRVRRWLVIDAATCHKVCVCSKSHLTSVMIRPGAPPSSIVREHTHTRQRGKEKRKKEGNETALNSKPLCMCVCCSRWNRNLIDAGPRSRARQDESARLGCCCCCR
jgi:hypothetical protein